MTPQEILEYNKRCAEFLEIVTNSGYWVEFDKTMPNYITMSYSKRHHIEQLCFHSDWNWIMEVLKAITKTGYNWELIDFNGTVKEEKYMKCSIFNLEIGKHYDRFMYESSDEKEAVVQAINQFLIWYGKENKV